MADIIQKIQFKRGTKDNLSIALVGVNKPAIGEPIYELDTGKIKIGNGINDYADLPYLAGGSGEIPIFFGSHEEFPSVGESNKLYIAIDEQLQYIWKSNRYEVLLAPTPSIIDGGNATTEF